MSSLPPPVPDHVATAQVFDFDIYRDQRFGEQLHESLARLGQAAPPLFWTPRNGGHWVLTRAEDIQQVVMDPEHFSVREMQIPRVPHPPTFIPLSLDPPDNQPYRAALMPAFSPKAVRALEDKIRHWARTIIDEAVAKGPKGQCDFVYDVTELFPVSVFMELMGMDLGRVREFRLVAEHFFENLDNAPEMEKAVGAIVGIMTEYIVAKQRQPDDSLISQLCQAQIQGRPIAMEEIQNMCLLLFAGGLHTVTNLAGFAYWHLAEHPELQRTLVQHPERIPDFVEESTRLFGVINTPRIVAKDTERFGASFKQGEMLLCMLPMASRDAAANPDPHRFDLDRKPREIMTFSRGPHLCVGHFLARSEIRILTEEWLQRVPSFRLQSGARQEYTTGTTFGLKHLPLEWS
ncbi:cytochrome P450 [Pelomonas sp. KK5]|uniref:cytochrome P450 n=1 Tax=Pelomonas sp. KK5 TaxID=1855730 RepID=UPI00097C85A6|nr:cytochrome P450 [Pelomonas sp. KK5]